MENVSAIQNEVTLVNLLKDPANASILMLISELFFSFVTSFLHLKQEGGHGKQYAQNMPGKVIAITVELLY